MTPLHTAAKQALDALEALQGGCTDHDDGTVEAITVWCPEVIDALREALAAPQPEPSDMVMVPREPTPEMIIEGSCAVKPGGFIEDIYAAMIAAAPDPAVPATFVVPGFAQWRDGSAAPVVREPQDERDARIEALQTECDASNAEGIELTAQVAALREEVAEVLAQNIKCVFAVNEYNTAIQNLVAERDALRSARIAYASAFSLNADGEPDVGNIHANIRAMKGRVKVLEDALRKAIVQNEHDMLMTGEELRAARAALGDAK